MMMDSDALRPVIIGMVVYLILSHLVPKVVTKPTEVKVVDDVVKFYIMQQSYLMPGAIVIGIIVYLTFMINQKM